MADFILKMPPQEYFHCFVINNQPYHSSNITLRLEEFSDAVKIILGFRKQSEKDTLKELEDQGPVYEERELFLHYLKLQMNCQ